MITFVVLYIAIAIVFSVWLTWACNRADFADYDD